MLKSHLPLGRPHFHVFPPPERPLARPSPYDSAVLKRRHPPISESKPKHFSEFAIERCPAPPEMLPCRSYFLVAPLAQLEFFADYLNVRIHHLRNQFGKCDCVMPAQHAARL